MPTIIMLGFYFLIILGISIVAYQVTHSHKDYILGGRSLNPFVTALGVGASDMSGWLIMGLPGAVYLLGYGQIWMPLGLLIGAFINWQLVSKRLRIYTQIAGDALTIPAYFSRRFKNHKLTLRVVSAVIILFSFTFYCAAGFIGGAKLFGLLFGLSYLDALMFSAPVIIIYTVIGGFLAVNWIDVFQGTLMLFAILLVPIIVFMQLGGWSDVNTAIQNIGFPFNDVIGSLNVLSILSLLAWGFGYFGQPHILVRFMAIRTPSDLSIAKNVCISWMFLSLLGVVAIGILGRVYFMEYNLPLRDPELVFLELSKLLFNPWITGILLAAALSAIMSTAAAQLMVSASALQEDFYHAFIRPKASSKELLWVGRSTVLAVAIFAFILAFNPESSVLGLVAHAWAGLGATFGPVILFSLFWPRMNSTGALCGMIAGSIGIIIFGFVFETKVSIDVYEILPAFLCGAIGIVIGSLLGEKPSTEVINDFNLMLKKLKEHS